MARYAVQFGAGNIGRGFLGQLFFESGYETVFIEAVSELVEALNARGGYPLRIVDEDGKTETRQIGNLRAVVASNVEAVGTAIARAHLGATAVGVNVLPKVAPALAAGIERRFAQPAAPPLNFIVCENLIGAGPFLREEVKKHLASRHHARLDNEVGFVEASIGRMVPVMTHELRAEDPLLVCVEPYCELPVDAQGFKGAIPPLAHMLPKKNFNAYVERKLFVHNAGHAVTAYLGYLRGHTYIWEAIADAKVRTEADAAIAESCAALAAKHGLPREELDAHWRELVRRFGNRALGDQVTRVAQDPVRKLGPNDRLIGAAKCCLEQGVEPARLAFAAAAAIRYDHPGDAAALQVKQLLAAHGLPGVVERICQLPPDSPLAGLIQRGDERLHAQGWTISK